MGNRLTQEEFIQKAKNKHGDKYDYDQSIYVNSHTKVSIFCKLHGLFWQSPLMHLSGSNCYSCSKIIAANKNRSTNTKFIAKAKSVHNGKYSYENVEYENNTTHVNITCEKHGNFKQLPSAHLSGRGCPKCGLETISEKIKETKEHFVEMAKRVHGNRYNYDKAIYKGHYEKLIIICYNHGEFELDPNHHICKRGNCPLCVVDDRRLGKEKFIEKAQNIHCNKYLYEKVEYKNTNTPVVIICKKHGEFKQKPQVHLADKGCPSCAGNKPLTTEDFLVRAKIIHDDFYGYDKVICAGIVNKVIINCYREGHGEFLQTAKAHLSGHGCPKCKLGKNENIVNKFLIVKNFEFVRQYNIAPLLSGYIAGGRGNRGIFCDFYVPILNLIIEYNGKQHYEPVKFRNNITMEEAKITLCNQQIRDEKVRSFCAQNNIGFLEIDGRTYTGEKLKQFLKDYFGDI